MVILKINKYKKLELNLLLIIIWLIDTLIIFIWKCLENPNPVVPTLANNHSNPNIKPPKNP